MVTVTFAPTLPCYSLRGGNAQGHYLLAQHMCPWSSPKLALLAESDMHQNSLRYLYKAVQAFA